MTKDEWYSVKEVRIWHLAVLTIWRIAEYAAALWREENKGQSNWNTAAALGFALAAVVELAWIWWVYWEEGGVLGLKFVEMMIEDHEILNKRFEKYRITTELEYLKEYEEMPSCQTTEKITRTILFWMMLLKVFLLFKIFGIVDWLSVNDAALLLTLFFTEDLIAYIAGVDEEEPSEENSILNISPIRKRKETIYMILFIMLSFTTTIFTLFVWNLGREHSSMLLAIIFKGIYKNRLKYFESSKMIVAAISAGTIIILEFSVSFSWILKSLTYGSVFVVLISANSKYSTLVRRGMMFNSWLTMTLFFGPSLEPIDLMFLAALVFIDSVSRYNKGAIVLADFFKFM